MKKSSSVIALLALSIVCGCGGNTDATSGNADTIECAIEIQVAVVSGLEPGFPMDGGAWQVVAACVLPVNSNGGPGHVISNTDGTIIELQWENIRTAQYGDRIELSGGEWRLRNRIDRADGISQTVAGGNSSPPLSFGGDFDWLVSCEIDDGSIDQVGRRLVVRGRLLAEEAPAPPLTLSLLTQGAG